MGEDIINPYLWMRRLEVLLKRDLSEDSRAYLEWVKREIMKSGWMELTQLDHERIFSLWNAFGDIKEDTLPTPRDSSSRKEDYFSGELEVANQEIKRLRELGKRVVAQRDEWEGRAKELERQVEMQAKSLLEETARRIEAERRVRELEKQLGDGLVHGIPQGADIKFTEAKRAFAKLYHPNASSNRSSLEQMVRGEIFKEFWAELERIESRN